MSWIFEHSVAEYMVQTVSYSTKNLFAFQVLAQVRTAVRWRNTSWHPLFSSTTVLSLFC